jgi:hypothetical protein
MISFSLTGFLQTVQRFNGPVHFDFQLNHSSGIPLSLQLMEQVNTRSKPVPCARVSNCPIELKHGSGAFISDSGARPLLC